MHEKTKTMQLKYSADDREADNRGSTVLRWINEPNIWLLGTKLARRKILHACNII